MKCSIDFPLFSAQFEFIAEYWITAFEPQWLFVGLKTSTWRIRWGLRQFVVRGTFRMPISYGQVRF